MDKSLRSVVSQLKKASKMHLAQSKIIEKHIKDMQKMSKKKKWVNYHQIIDQEVKMVKEA